MDWTLLSEAKRDIENSVLAKEPARAAKANVETIGAVVGGLERR
jgi:hypothetical protein